MLYMFTFRADWVVDGNLVYTLQVYTPSICPQVKYSVSDVINDITGIAPYDITGISPYDITGIAPYDITGIAPYDITGIAPNFHTW